MGFWANLKEKHNQKKEEKKHYKENKSNLAFGKEIKKLSKKHRKLDNEFFEDLEALLIGTDMGVKMTIKISNNVQKRMKKNSTFEDIKEILVEEMYDSYNDSGKWVKKLNYVDGRINIFIIVGVNGVGKTTSIAKLANFYSKQGKKVLIAAGDTFRAGAVEQLQEWVDKRLTNVDLVKGSKPNQDPASVVFDAIEKAKKEKYDLLLIDTAGRLQTKQNLMKELEKIVEIIHRLDKKSPHERLLVIDSTTGQNGINQALKFSEATDVTGIILTKTDGTSKGGIALAIKDSLNIPVKLIGTGETVDDLEEFNLNEYVYDLAKGFMDDEINE
ncbi:signal recognition particle-docking protein FtsY [Spiroplasma endosymbiont of Aspidapion aeneum]|uniref:signal recognition particle-docking protein FtsY n=1 Tax=Spiroplasma endosymbiont of Aspidapion aeneum TaxID=3066276 RepID=UPI00313CA403